MRYIIQTKDTAPHLPESFSHILDLVLSASQASLTSYTHTRSKHIAVFKMSENDEVISLPEKVIEQIGVYFYIFTLQACKA